MKKIFTLNLLGIFFLLSLTLGAIPAEEMGNEIIVYGIIDASPPFMFVNDQGEADGFAVDLYTRMMGDLEIPYEIRIEQMNILYKDLLEGEIDLFTGMLYTRDNEDVFYFPHTSFKTSWGELFVGADALYSDIYDLEGKTIGMVMKDLNGKNFMTFMDQFEIQYTTREYPSFNDLFKAVREGDIFGGITNSQYQEKSEKGGIKPTATTFYPSSSYAVTSLEKGNIRVLERLSAYLSELKDDPQSYYYELEQKWYNPGQYNLNSKVLRIVIISLIMLCVVIIILIMNNRYLKREVTRQVEQLKGQKDEKEKVELKNDFLASISHELRTPVNNITSLIYLLSQTNLNTNQKDKINKINKASHLLLSIISNFLDYNNLEKGQIILESQPFSLKGEVDDIVSLFHDEVKEKGLYLESHLDRNIPEMLWGDAFRLKQILTNLLENAVKFSKRGTISLAVFVEELSKQNCCLNISIKDQGMGIDQDKLESLFLPFTQADASISRQFGGSGLGLAICYQLVHLMKGSITVTSQKGIGSEFSLSLPFKIARKKDRKEESYRKGFDSYKGAKVLYVEDNSINREIGLELLHMAEITVSTAENGMDALTKLKEDNFDLILMDIQMPFMDGLTTAQKIREQEKEKNLKRLPIVALTAQFLEEDINNAYQAGMDGHISKPISIGKLNREFEKWLSPYQTKAIKDRKVAASGILSIPGIDIDDVLEQLNGNYELLIDSLNRFIDEYSLMSGLLLSLANQHKEKDLSKEIHTLKGVLGSLGMGGLYRKALKIEKLVLSEKEYTIILREFCLELEDQINTLKGILGNA